MFLFRLLKYFAGPYEVVGTVVLPAVFFAALFFWPLLDRNPRCDPRRRPLAIALLVLATAGLLGSTIYAVATDVRLPVPAMAATLEPSVPPPAGPIQRLQIARIYHDDCGACHGDDGSGSPVRAAMPSIPDFRNMAWQTTKTDFEIIRQIQAGKEPLMPAFRSKLSQEQILGLAIFLRAFAVTPAAESHPAPVAAQPPGELPPQRKSSKTSEVSPANPQAIPPVAPREMPPSSHQPPILRLAAPILFRDLCMACHGADGRGTPVRPAMPAIPDFTNSKWQHSRTDTELQHSILEGKGKFMLPMKSKVDAAGAKDLAAYVRNFTAGKQVVAVERTPQSAERLTVPKLSETVPNKENPLPAPAAREEDSGRHRARAYRPIRTPRNGRAGCACSGIVPAELSHLPRRRRSRDRDVREHAFDSRLHQQRLAAAPQQRTVDGLHSEWEGGLHAGLRPAVETQRGPRSAGIRSRVWPAGAGAHPAGSNGLRTAVS